MERIALGQSERWRAVPRCLESDDAGGPAPGRPRIAGPRSSVGNENARRLLALTRAMASGIVRIGVCVPVRASYGKARRCLPSECDGPVTSVTPGQPNRAVPQSLPERPARMRMRRCWSLCRVLG
jgi:hypothetical protein